MINTGHLLLSPPAVEESGPFIALLYQPLKKEKILVKLKTRRHHGPQYAFSETKPTKSSLASLRTSALMEVR